MGGRGKLHSPEERQRILKLLDEAIENGARVEKACAVFDLSERTIQRWRAHDGGDRRRGSHCPPSNKLSAEEREEVLTFVNSKEYRDLSPKQMVPLLADKGRYVASESTVYRILREEKMVNHREPSRPAAPPPREHVATGPCQGLVVGYHLSQISHPRRVLLPLSVHGCVEPKDHGRTGFPLRVK